MISKPSTPIRELKKKSKITKDSLDFKSLLLNSNLIFNKNNNVIKVLSLFTLSKKGIAKKGNKNKRSYKTIKKSN